MKKNNLLLVAVVSSLGFAGACVDNQLEGDSPSVGDPGTGGTTSGDPTNTFDHDNSGISPWELVDRLTKEGPPRYTSHVHSCSKVRYANLENVLRSIGIDVANNTNLSAGRLYREGINAMGAPNYGARIRENIGISTSGSSRLFDIFAAGATEVINAVPTLERCISGGTPAQLFNGNTCVASGITCITGVPATQAHVDLCTATISMGSTPEIGQQIAVATMLAAAYTCE